jgi:TPR repeat protein
MMISLVSYLVLGISVAMGQTSTSPAASSSQQQVMPSPLSRPEILQLQTKADAGDANAQTMLGEAYRDSNGVPQNDALALKWFGKAANQGGDVAENDLGNMYNIGAGVEVDKKEAVRWYHKSAKQGNSKAMFNLGASYYNGDGVEVDQIASLAWFLLAQEAGSRLADGAVRRAIDEKEASPMQAAARIGHIYEAGDELPKNPAEALKWYRTAADAGDAQSGVKVASLLLAPGRSPTPEEYGEVHRRCEDAAKRNSTGAYCMALVYKRGLGVAKDPVASTKWLERAAELGHHKAQLELGEAYWKGVGVSSDPVLAYAWIWLAYGFKVPDAEQDEEQLGKELSTKQMEQAKKKAADWIRTHGFLLSRPRENPAPAN